MDPNETAHQECDRATLIEQKCRALFSEYAVFDLTPCVEDVHDAQRRTRGGSFADVFVQRLHEACPRCSTKSRRNSPPFQRPRSDLIAVKRFRTHVDSRSVEKTYKVLFDLCVAVICTYTCVTDDCKRIRDLEGIVAQEHPPIVGVRMVGPATSACPPLDGKRDD
jgi:hypothetical protein